MPLKLGFRLAQAYLLWETPVQTVLDSRPDDEEYPFLSRGCSQADVRQNPNEGDMIHSGSIGIGSNLGFGIARSAIETRNEGDVEIKGNLDPRIDTGS